MFWNLLVTGLLNHVLLGFWKVGMKLLRLVLINKKCNSRAWPTFNLGLIASFQ
jgi:hypothetical protein